MQKPLPDSYVRFYRLTRDFYRETITFLMGADENHKGEIEKAVAYGNVEDLVNAAFAMRELLKLLDGAAKELRKFETQLHSMACACWVRDATVNLNLSEKIQTAYCTCSPDLKQAPQIPGRDTPEYKAMLADFGIPETASDLVRMHWPTLVEVFSQREAEGRPRPSYLNSADGYNVFRLVNMRKRKEVDAGSR